MLSPEEIDDLADAIDARCAELGDEASPIMEQAYLEVLSRVPDPPAWFAVCVEMLLAGWRHRSEIVSFTRDVRRNLDLEEGVRIDRAIGDRTLRAHPYFVLGRKEADRQRVLGSALEFVIECHEYQKQRRPDGDEVLDFYQMISDLPEVAVTAFDVLKRRLSL